MRKPLLKLMIVLIMASSFAQAGEGEQSDTESPGFFNKVLWYLPNRVFDLLDIVRLRAAVGPGLEAGVRVTDAASLYLGNSRTLWVGLPGEREPGGIPHPAGASQKRGIVLFGVDATDITPNPPNYKFSEIGFQLHLGLVGVEAGLVPTEIIDFFFGLIGKDWSGDDGPHPTRPPETGSGRVINFDHEDRYYPLAPRPDTFHKTSERLDYLYENMPVRMRGYMHSMDRSLVDEEKAMLEQPPVTDLEIGFWLNYISEPTDAMDVDQRFRLDVEFPNFERNLSLFVDTDYNDELPGTDISDTENSSFVVGFRRQMEKLEISGDLGIKTKWPPELFARVRWRPEWSFGETRMNFEQRLFWENEDGFGVLSNLQAYRWLGESHDWILRSVTAGRFSESTDGGEWQQSLKLGYMTDLVEENRRRENLGVDDAIQCLTFTASVFGNDRDLTKYRSTLLYRYPLYKRFVLLEVEPGMEWRDENDWTSQYRLDVGMILIF